MDLQAAVALLDSLASPVATGQPQAPTLGLDGGRAPDRVVQEGAVEPGGPRRSEGGGEPGLGGPRLRNLPEEDQVTGRPGGDGATGSQRDGVKGFSIVKRALTATPPRRRELAARYCSRPPSEDRSSPEGPRLSFSASASVITSSGVFARRSSDAAR